MQARFNVRAYGIWLNSRSEVLLSEETHAGHRLVKFPGGGLEFGEGLVDCLKREWREETGLTPRVMRHYYTTDFFQPSAFAEGEQIISVYYLVQCEEALAALDGLAGKGTAQQRFFWHPLAALADGALTLPIDRHVAAQLHTDFAQTLAGVA